MVEEGLSSELVSFVDSLFGTTVGVEEDGITVNGSFDIEEEGTFDITPF